MIKEGDRKVGRSTYNEQSGSVEKVLAMEFNNNNNPLYFKLPYLSLSNFAQRKVRTLIKRYFSNLNIKLVFSSFEI